MRIKTSTVRFLKKYRLPVACAAFLVALIVIETSVLIQQSAPKPYTKSDYAEARMHWKEEIEEYGTLKAYERFKKDTQNETYGTAHTLAHIFGELVYDIDGLEGVVVCDSSFSMGCFHSFFGKAIKENGVEIIYKLDSDCESRWGDYGLFCAHGIGHGLLTYLGDDKLDEALDICSKLAWEGEHGGCSGGVFMEHDFQTMREPIRAHVRVFDSANPYSPCDKIQKFKGACYFALGQWWFSALNQDYVRMGELCEAIKDTEYKKSCGRGIGGIVGPHLEFNTEEIFKACAFMSNKEIDILCRQGAAWSYKGEPSQAARATEPCVGMSDLDYKACAGGSMEKGDGL